MSDERHVKSEGLNFLHSRSGFARLPILWNGNGSEKSWRAASLLGLV